MVLPDRRPTRPLARVRWLGGSACAGKTTLARRLGERHGLTVVHCDDLFEEHTARAVPGRHDAFLRLASLPATELFAGPVERQVRALEAFYEDEMEMLIEDLRKRLGQPGPGLFLVEGAGLIPTRVAPLIDSPGDALWLLATEDFRRRHYRERPDVVKQTLAGVADPDRLFEGWMDRDDAWTATLSRQVARLGLAFLPVTGDLSLDELEERVAERLLGKAASGPGAGQEVQPPA